MFGTRQEKAKIDDEVYVIRALTGEDLDKFYTVIEKLEPLMKENVKEEDAMKNLNPEALKLLHFLITKTLLKAYPDMAKRKDEVEEFVTQHVFEFLEPFMKVNLPQNK